MNDLLYLIVGLGLFWALVLWARKTEEGKVHDPMWDRLLHVAEKFAKDYGIKNLGIVTSPSAPVGVMYLMDMDAFKLPPSPYGDGEGEAMDISFSRKWLVDNEGEQYAEWLYQYSLHFSMRREAARTNAVIKNITDSDF